MPDNPQHALKELTDKLVKKVIEVKYPIHLVAGRMPGYMNVQLAEAEVSYVMVFDDAKKMTEGVVRAVERVNALL